jgi:hypothetical protein
VVNKTVAMAYTCKSSNFTKYSTEDVLIFSSKMEMSGLDVGDLKERPDVTVYTVLI